MTWLEPYIGMLKAAIVAAMALGLIWIGHHYGAQGVQAAWDKERAAQAEAANRAIFERIRNNERIAEQQEINTAKLKKGYADEIASIRAAALTDRGLRLPASVCSGFAATAKTKSASGSDAADSATVALPTTIERDLRELMREADTITAGCRVAQQFISDNGMAP